MNEARQINDPRPGFFCTRLIKGGPEVPARIWRLCNCTPNGGDKQTTHEWAETCDRFSQELQAEINGQWVDIWRVWTGAKMTTEKHWQELTLRTKQDPYKAVTLGKMKPLF